MKIKQYLHTSILVSDLAKSEYFYSEILGLAKVARSLNFPGIWYQIGDFQLHLIISKKIIDDRIDQTKWGRNRHIAFAIEDLASAQAKLLAHNCSMQVSASGRSALFTQDPDGNIIELTELS